MIGDSDVDILTARNAGVWSMGCSYGLAPHTLVRFLRTAWSNRPRLASGAGRRLDKRRNRYAVPLLTLGFKRNGLVPEGRLSVAH